MRILLTNILLVIFASIIVIAERPMRCYQCNSMVDPNCDSNDVNKLKSYIKLCPLLQDGTFAGNEPIACRKILQNVEELPTHTIRECAYTGDKQVDGMRKQGSKAIKLLYYQCENVDGDKPCNSAQQLTTHLIFTILFLGTVFIALHF